MLQRELIDSTQIEDGVCLELYRHGTDFMIVLGRNELMSTRMRFSEEQLAQLTIDRLGKEHARMLIGGYGMGFTYRAAAARLGEKAQIVVAEISDAIIDWAKGPMAELTGEGLSDPRLDLKICDVAALIDDANDGTCAKFDAILLDVDNGPDGIVRDANNRIYSRTGLAKARDALKPGGILAVWSAGPDPAFVKRLRDTGLEIVEWNVRSRPNKKGAHHIIWFARKS
ncbi:spermidine synthase [Erythromicrobium ramosum]|uniref:Spermidine synthase n=1 Tax=Erythrobacter ramosus TaxID=35811 RepID=A0A6I4ULI0_9SPHN|nr:spermidine synthase [Erythrobacter ramosus]MBB3776987.1 spermidine synthase [Erythrobacter ramosus]MXP39871.1 spermidine synthase [Erythrobacter ramosus]